jgi:adenylate cyclase
MATRAARTETTYEVYLLQGRQWQLHARYRSNEKDSAIAEARDLDRRGEAHGVKVVREVFYPDYNRTDEAVVYVGHKGMKKAQQSGESVDEIFYGNEGAALAGPSLSGPYIAWRIIVITFFSLGFGIALAMGTSMIMAYLAHVGATPEDPAKAKTFVFSAFFLGVIGVALPMLITLFAAMAHGGQAERPSAPRKPAPPKPKPKKLSEPAPIEHHDFDFGHKDEDSVERSYSVESFDGEEEPGESKRPWWKLGWFSQKEKDGAGAEESAGMSSTLDEPGSAAALPGEDPAFSIAHEEEEEEQEPEPLEEKSEAVDFEQHRLNIMRFLGGAIAVIKTVRPQLDAYTKFAFDLVLAGACEVVAATGKLGERDKRDILKEAVLMIGTKPDLAQAFADKYEAYFAEERYKKMADLGREAMERFLSGDPQPFIALPSAIESWDKPQSRQAAQQSIMTVFFTDMVGSTDMTQEKGDFAAQEIVRRHNAIVRSALAEHGGREIKHTGDGIMATCPTAASAVQACIDIQRAIASFNATNPPIPLEVRIGLNAGEPIVEENDLFGATVQLAARVCAYAKARQIVCSQSVVDLAQSKASLFTSLGQVMLKGFKEPVPVFEVGWGNGGGGQSMPQMPSVPPGV